MIHRHSNWTRGLAVVSLVCLIASIGVFHNAATAQNSGKTAPVTAVAVVDVNRVLDGLQETLQIQSRLASEQDQRKRQLTELGDQVKAAEARLEATPKDRLVERQKLAGQIVELQVLFKARDEVLMRLSDLDLGREMWSLYTRINDAVARTAQQQGFDLVITDDSRINIPEGRQLTGTEVRKITTERQVLFAGPRVDITEQVITMMNNEFQARAGKR